MPSLVQDGGGWRIASAEVISDSAALALPGGRAGGETRFVPKLLILLSLMILLLAWLARWWFWRRVRERGQRMECAISVGQLRERLGVLRKRGNEACDAAALGSALRDCGLRLLERDGLILAKKRRGGWWSLRILPGLLAVVLVFAAFSKGVAIGWVLAVGMLLIALHVALRVVGLGIELKAVNRAFSELEKVGGLRRMSEEEAMLECARASVWDTILPW